MHSTPLLLLLLATVLLTASAKVLYSEDFSNDPASRWVQSGHKKDYGKFDFSAGKYFNDAEQDVGLQTSQDAKFYAISSEMPTAFSSEGKQLVVQFTMKHEQGIDCGGGYIKLMPAGLDQAKFNGESEYNIMFGPDICGNTKKVHVIFNYNGKNLDHKRGGSITPPADSKSHAYTLIINTDGTYEIRVDNNVKVEGELEADWDFLEPKEIADPDVSKPEDWVDERNVVDPDDVKPDDWDATPEFIEDPDAEKPDDWDDEEDGEYEAPMVPNPDFKGEWSPAMIPNPDYQGVWEAPKIPNPDYEADDNLGQYESFAFVGIDIWQVKSGSIWDNILIADDVADAVAAFEGAVRDLQTGEAAAETAAREAEAAAEAEADDNEEDEEEDEDEDEEHDEL